MRRSLMFAFGAALAGSVLRLSPLAAAQPPVWWAYHWQQPGTAAVTTPNAQPSFLPLPTVQGFENPARSATYVWAQPPARVNPTPGCA